MGYVLGEIGRSLSDWRAVARVESFDLALPVGGGAALEHAHAAVPAQDRVVVADRSNLFRVLEAVHGFFEKNHDGVGASARAQERFGAALMDDTRVVETLVGIPKPLKDAFCLGVPVSGPAGELIGDRER